MAEEAKKVEESKELKFTDEELKSLSSSLWTPEVSASYALLQTSQSLGL